MWQPIERMPEHGKLVLLGWDEFGEWQCEVSAYSTGRRYDNGYSSVSYHAYATHWQPLPEPPQ